MVASNVEIGDAAPETELGLGDIIAIIWKRRWFVVTVSLISAIGAGVGLYFTPKTYEATVLLAPVASQSSNGLGALGSVASQLGGLASLAGVSLPSIGAGKAEAVATLQSATLTGRYIRENNLLPILFSDKWDGKRKMWKTSKPPTPWLASQFFNRKVRKVNENAKSGLVSLTIAWTDPRLAAQWANDLVEMTNGHLRSKALEESERAIAYLRDQAAGTNNVELRNAIYSLMKSEIEKEMLARGREEYALKIVDPAIAPEKHSSPSRLLWLLAGLAGGFTVAAGIALARNS